VALPHSVRLEKEETTSFCFSLSLPVMYVRE
jgi:hypothetical protein